LDITSKAQVVVDIIIRNLYERTADVGFLSTDNEIRQFILGKVSKESVVERLKEYCSKYTVYDEIIILDKRGRVLANLDEKSGIFNSHDSIVHEAIHQEGYLESFSKTDLRPSESRSLIYAQKIEDPESGEPIGVLCLCFRFNDEMAGIFSSLKNKGDKSVMCLLDSKGHVIASSDETTIPIGRQFSVHEKTEFSVVEYGGRDYLAKTCKTRGYQGFFGLGWYGHVMVPADAFKSSSGLLENIDSGMLDQIMQYADTFCPELSAIVSGADDINLALRRVVWNGQVMAAGGKGDLVRLKAILRQISKNGQKTREVFENSITNLYQTVISSSLSDVKFIARLMIDIMDRNLYERANDCRWWALASDIRRMLDLEQKTEADIAHITGILSYINSLYTVYTRIIVYDTEGTVLAASNLHEDTTNAAGRKIDTTILASVLRLENSQSYAVSAFQKTWLYENRATYIYHAAIRSLENPHAIVGGIGIVFDSEPEFSAMLCDSLPHKEGSFALFTDRSGTILSSTTKEYSAGSKLEIEKEFLEHANGDGSSKIIIHRGNYYIVGCMTSSGYREYKNSGDYSNDVIAFVFVPIGAVRQIEKQTENVRCVTGSIKSNETVDLATILVSGKVYALPASSVVEAVEGHKLTALPGSKPPLVGTIAFKGTDTGDVHHVVPVINPAFVFVSGETAKTQDSQNREQIVIIRTSQGLVGVLVQDLDAVPEFDLSRLEEFPLIMGNDPGYVKSIIKPEASGDIDDLLLVLDPDKLVAHVMTGNKPLVRNKVHA